MLKKRKCGFDVLPTELCSATWSWFRKLGLLLTVYLASRHRHAENVSANKVDPRHCYLIVRNSLLYSSDNVSTLFCRY